jgi:uncharacterized phage protein gp47/JayE
MPLPFPDLDTRRWSDLVDEGRGLIPRYASKWSDHNYHDPGIMLIEFLAWMVEHDIYRVNRVPERHYRTFLHLVGFDPDPPKPARGPVEFQLVDLAPEVQLLAGLALVTNEPDQPRHLVRTLEPVTIVQSRIASVYSFDGRTFTNQARSLHNRLPFALFGNDPIIHQTLNPEEQPALYLGFDSPLPVDVSVSLWFQFSQNGVDWEQHRQIIEHAADERIRCGPIRPTITCDSAGRNVVHSWNEADTDHALKSPHPALPEAIPPHHSIRLEWDYFGQGDWKKLNVDEEEVQDKTRGFTLDGNLLLRLPSPMELTALEPDGDEHFFVRCRLASGTPDVAPIAQRITINAVAAEQSSLVTSSYSIRPGAQVPPHGEIVQGEYRRLVLSFDDSGSVERIELSKRTDVPESLVIDYQADMTDGGHIETTLCWLGNGTGLPDQTLMLPMPAISNGEIYIWAPSDEHVIVWEPKPSLDASRRTSSHVVCNPSTGLLRFGNAERGRVIPAGMPVFASYAATSGSDGNLASNTSLVLDTNAEKLNSSLTGESTNQISSRISSIATIMQFTGGQDEESVAHAAGRATEMLWAHERLLEICPLGKCETLDSLSPAVVRSRTAPPRASTLLDYERIALSVPGTRVRRARAWSNIDPSAPCIEAVGTVALVIVNELPQSRPHPSDGLLEAVARFIEPRRTIGTRLVVIGPSYLEITVNAIVRAKRGAHTATTYQDIMYALDRFLDPLVGGTSGLGWPFGRDVFRSEILHIIDTVAGVDHVLDLELLSDQGDQTCGNICVPPTYLVTPGAHEIGVVR